MMDQSGNDAPQSPAEAAALQANPPQLTGEQLEKLKIGWVDKARELYTDFINKIAGLPGHAVAKHRSFGHFDDGYLWLKESILNIQSIAAEVAPQGIAVGEQCGSGAQSDSSAQPLPAEDQPANSPAE